MTCVPGHLCAEQNVGNLEKCTSTNSGTPVRRTKRRKSPKHALLGILGLLCAEQDVGNLKRMHFHCAQNKTSGNLKRCTFNNYATPVRRTRCRKFQQIDFQDFWDSCAQNKTVEMSTMHCQHFWDFCAQNKTSEISENALQEFGDSCAQNKTSEISKNALSEDLGLLYSERNVENLKQMYFHKF